MAVQMAMAKLDEIGRAIQDQDARTMIASRRREIIDWLRTHPGLGAVIEVQFLEPEHRFQDVTWRSSDDPYAGKPTRVANPEARQPQSTFLYVEPMREAQAGQTAPGAAPPTEVKTGAEFVAAYGKARGADLAGTGTVAVEMHEALRQGTKVFGYTDVRVGNTTIRLTDAARGSIEEAVGQLARQATTKRLGRLKGGIDTQQARLTERLRQWFSGGIKLTGHELDPARAHYAAAANYANDQKFGPALESINAGDAQVEEVWAELYEYDYGHRPAAPPIW
jgi:hypothetical protein